MYRGVSCTLLSHSPDTNTLHNRRKTSKLRNWHWCKVYGLFRSHLLDMFGGFLRNFLVFVLLQFFSWSRSRAFKPKIRSCLKGKKLKLIFDVLKEAAYVVCGNLKQFAAHHQPDWTASKVPCLILSSSLFHSVRLNLLQLRRIKNNQALITFTGWFTRHSVSHPVKLFWFSVFQMCSDYSCGVVQSMVSIYNLIWMFVL